jgi:hypothetical protein
MQIGFGKLREEQGSITTRFQRRPDLLPEAKHRVSSNQRVSSILFREERESNFKGAKEMWELRPDLFIIPA